VTLN